MDGASQDQAVPVEPLCDQCFDTPRYRVPQANSPFGHASVQALRRRVMPMGKPVAGGALNAFAVGRQDGVGDGEHRQPSVDCHEDFNALRMVRGEVEQPVVGVVEALQALLNEPVQGKERGRDAGRVVRQLAAEVVAHAH